jgi:hypothetical protein
VPPRAPQAAPQPRFDSPSVSARSEGQNEPRDGQNPANPITREPDHPPYGTPPRCQALTAPLTGDRAAQESIHPGCDPPGGLEPSRGRPRLTTTSTHGWSRRPTPRPSSSGPPDCPPGRVHWLYGRLASAQPRLEPSLFYTYRASARAGATAVRTAIAYRFGANRAL